VCVCVCVYCRLICSLFSSHSLITTNSLSHLTTMRTHRLQGLNSSTCAKTLLIFSLLPSFKQAGIAIIVIFHQNFLLFLFLPALLTYLITIGSSLVWSSVLLVLLCIHMQVKASTYSMSPESCCPLCARALHFLLFINYS